MGLKGIAKKNMQNKIIFILIFIILIILGGGFYMFIGPGSVTDKNIYIEDDIGDVIATSTATITEIETKDDELESEENILEEKTAKKEFIYFEKKAPGNDIEINAVFLKQGGFVVVYENTAVPMGELLAISKYLEVGEHFEIPLHLFRKTKDGEVFTVMLHADDGDKKFDLSKDAPVRDDKGEGVYTELIIESPESA